MFSEFLFEFGPHLVRLIHHLAILPVEEELVDLSNVAVRAPSRVGQGVLHNSENKKHESLLFVG